MRYESAWYSCTFRVPLLVVTSRLGNSEPARAGGEGSERGGGRGSDGDGDADAVAARIKSEDATAVNRGRGTQYTRAWARRLNAPDVIRLSGGAGAGGHACVVATRDS